jgi:hypothetical protein
VLPTLSLALSINAITTIYRELSVFTQGSTIQVSLETLPLVGNAQLA